MIKYDWRRIAFSLVVLAYLGFLGFITLMMFLPGSEIAAMGHFSFFSTGETHDLIHELIFALIIGTAAVGLFSQLWKPKKNFAGQLVALFAWVVMFLVGAFTNNWTPQQLFLIFGGLTLLATILHPAGLGLFSWVRSAKLNRVLLTLVIIAAVPLTVFAFTNFNLQIAGGGTGGGDTGFSGLFGHQKPAIYSGDSAPLQDQPLIDTESMTTNDEADHNQKHVALGHYRNIAVLSFIIILIGVLASFRPKGWRLAAWVAGFLPILLGFASVILPNAESSIGLFWGIIAIIWGVVFVTTSEKVYKKDLQVFNKK